MREIKFRAYEKDSGEMFYPDTTNNNECFFSGLIDGVLKVATSPYSSEQDYVLMQYTGLKDANDKEIYEGDILSEIGEEPFYMEFSDEKSAFCFVDKSNPHDVERYTVQDLHYEGLKVIGNIYENPELLEIC